MLRRSLSAWSFLLAAALLPSSAVGAGDYSPDEVVVLLRETPGTGGRSAPLTGIVQARADSLGLAHDRVVAAASPKRSYSVHVLRSASAGFDPVAAAAALRGTPGVVAAIPNVRLRLHPTFPNDPMRTMQWHVDSGDSADIELTAAWDVARGDTGTVIGVMDTGIDLGHPDLASKIWTNWLEATGTTGVDDDGNGYVDDVHGWDFGNDDADPNPEPTIDEIGLDIGFHGTFVAGLAAAATHNALGISGVAWNCRLMPLKVSNSSGTIDSDAVAGAFAYATDQGISVLNMSLGGPGQPGVPEFYQALVDDANAAGVMSVAAAGNDGTDVESYPAATDGVLAVAATDEWRQRSTFSNYGPWVDLAAPGEYLWSSICRNYIVDDISQLFYVYFFEWDGIDPYMRGDGTSFACPIASGVAALVRALHPELPPAAVANHLVATGDIIPFDQPVGPKVNAWRAVSTPVAAADEAPAAAAISLRIVPHPIRGSGVIRLDLARDAATRLEIFDLTGRRVRTLLDRRVGAGSRQVPWYGRDDQGRRLPDGVYLVRLRTGSETAVARAVLLRR